MRLRQELVASGRVLVIYVVQEPVTVALLASILKQPVADLLRLNPSLSRSLTVKTGTVVKYFKPRAT